MKAMEEDDPKEGERFHSQDDQLYLKGKNGQEIRRWVFDIRKIKKE